MRAVSLVRVTVKVVDTADRKVCFHSALGIASESMIHVYGPTLTSVIVINLDDPFIEAKEGYQSRNVMASMEYWQYLMVCA
jgi:hypothetical protein